MHFFSVIGNDRKDFLTLKRQSGSPTLYERTVEPLDVVTVRIQYEDLVAGD